MKCKFFLSLILIFLIHGTVLPQIIHVTPSGSGLKDGSSWANALAGNDSAASGYTRLADTMRHAFSGAEFWVAEGAYLPCWDNDRNKAFEIVQNISVYGGFSGMELTTSDRNWQLHQTVFSGNIGLDSLKTDNAYHVFSTAGTGWTIYSLLDGIIVEEGYADNPSFQNSDWRKKGGGIYNSQKLTVKNCILQYCHGCQEGGAVYNSGTVHISDCLFYRNSAQYNGAGFFNAYTTNPNIVGATVKTCKFSNNSGGYNGGGICNSGVAEIFNCLIVNNHGYNGGGLYGGSSSNSSYVNTRIYNTTIANNTKNLGFWSGHAKIYNSIVWESGVSLSNNPDFEARYSSIYGISTGIGNLNSNPLFSNPTQTIGNTAEGLSGDWSLRWCSPCFNTGDTTLLLPGNAYDLSGATRIRYGSLDMGAFELDTTGLIPNAVGFQNNRIYVTDSNVYHGNGSSWETALAGNAESCKYPGQSLLYEAMKDANPGIEIWVQKGIYKASLSHKRDHSFNIGHGVKVIGGFTGFEISPAERTFDGLSTILSGEIGDTSKLSDNCFHVILLNSETQSNQDTALVEGLTIERGYADGSNDLGEGAGILVHPGVKIRLKEVVIQKNVSKGNGGGMRVKANANVEMRNCTVQTNRVIKTYSTPTYSYSAFGSGIFNSGYLNLSNTLIRSNDSATEGGGIYSEDTLFLSHCIIDSNYAVTKISKGGGLANTGFCSLSHTAIRSNTTQIQGGGIWNKPGAVLHINSCEIAFNRNLSSVGNGGGIYNDGIIRSERTTIQENLSMNDGGGVYNSPTSQALISDCRITRNTAGVNTNTTGGGGIFNAGILNITRSRICNNTTTGSGGGIYNPTRVSNCLIANNSKGGSFSTGGGLKISNGCEGIYNSTIVNNTGQGIAATSVSGQTMQEIPIQDTTILVNSIIWGNDAQISGNYHKLACIIQNNHSGGSIYFDDPVFLSPSIGIGPDFDGLIANWNLSACSPAIDRADADFIMSADSLDLNGLIRISGSAADFGAFEFQCTPQTFSYSQPVVYVNEDTIPGGTGTSWNDPIHGNAPSCRYPGYNQLYQVMRDLPDSCEIWIKTGIYKTSLDSDRKKSFLLQEGLKIYGGFSGYEISPDQRDFMANPTILSANINSESDSTDNAYHVFYSYNQGEAWTRPAVLDGLTIRDGSAIYSCGYCTHDDIVGGGLFIKSNCNVELNNCVITKNSGLGNYTTNPLEIGRIGGSGIYNTGHLKMYNSIISFNTNNEMGGGIFNESWLEMKLCKVDNNQILFPGSQYYELWGGGGIYNYLTGTLVLDSCEINNNNCNNTNFYGSGIRSRGQLSICNSTFHANNNIAVYSEKDLSIQNCLVSDNYGGIITSESLTAKNCTFTRNQVVATLSGGRTHIDSCEFSYNANGIQTQGIARITNSKIHHNNNSGFIVYPQTGWFGIIVVVVTKVGAGIRHEGDSLFVDNCDIYNNTSAGGAALCLKAGYGLIKNSYMYYNMADAGAALKNFSHLDVHNCVITNNYANRHGILCNVGYSTMNIYNSTIANNSINTSWSIDGNFWHGGHQDDTGTSSYFFKNSIIDYDNSPLFANYTGNMGIDSINFSSVSGGYPGTGNTMEDPLFLNPVTSFDTIITPTSGGFRLHPCSPCINAGNDSLVADTLDLDGNPRIVEHVDMGAYEYPVVETGHRIFGSIYYDNEDTTAVDSVWVILRNETMAIDSFQTRAPGEYCFSNVQAGQYHIECRSVRTSGGSSSLDAFLILKHFTQFNFLTGLRLLAASTDTYPWINAIDGLLVHRKFTGAIPHYNAPEWIFETKTVLMTNENLNIPIRAICRGDVDASFEP